jgi:hypothetical protein
MKDKDINKKKDLVLPEIDANYLGLRDSLFDELNGVRTGTISLEHARVVALLAKRLIDLANLSLYAKGELQDDKMKRLVIGNTL